MPILLARWPDGSSNAPAGGHFSRPGFFTTARQSGQSAYTKRPPWLVAGVDYAIGVDAAHINSLVDPTVSTPANCTVGSNNHIQWAGTGSDQTIEGYDFSLNGGANNGVSLRLDGTSAGASKLTVKNCKFFNGSNVQGGSYLISTVSGVGATFNLDLIGCEFDGNYGNFPNSTLTALASHVGSAGAFTTKYCVFLQSPQSFTETSGIGDRTELYNYGEDMVAPGTSGHHASWPSSQFSSGVMQNYRFSFNTAFMNRNAGPAADGVTSFCEVGSNGATRMNCAEVSFNTLVVNSTNGAGTRMSYMAEVNGSPSNMQVDRFILINNYYDKTGAIAFYSDVSAPVIVSRLRAGNIDMTTGASD